MTKNLEVWVNPTRNALEFSEGSVEIWVLDTLKAGVSEACSYEPDINPTYSEMAAHYGAAVIPARLRKPRDQANVVIREKLDMPNNEPFHKMDGTRTLLYEQIDRPAPKPLP